MAIAYDITERTPDARPGLTRYRVVFHSPDDGDHSNIFLVQEYPTGRRLARDAQGRYRLRAGGAVTELDPLNLADLLVETFQRDLATEFDEAVQRYWQRKVGAAAEGRPYPRHHNTTLNLQVGATANDGHSFDTVHDLQTGAAANEVGDRTEVGKEDADAFYHFTGVSGLGGTTINSATLQLYGHPSNSGAGTPATRVYANDVAAPTAPTTRQIHLDKVRTTASVVWTGVLTASAWNSKVITAVIQELADTFNPSAIQILHDNDASASDNYQRPSDYSNSGAQAAKLDIDYTSPGTTVTPATVALVLTAFAPSVVIGTVVTPTTLALVLTTFAPAINVGTIVTPTTLALALTFYAPTVSVSDNKLATPDTLALTLTTYAPTIAVSDHKTVTPATLALALTTYAPAIVIGTIVTPSTVALVLTTFAPTVSVSDHKLVTPTTLALALSTFAPTVAPDLLVTPGTLALALTFYAPTVRRLAGFLYWDRDTRGPGAESLVGDVEVLRGPTEPMTADIEVLRGD